MAMGALGVDISALSIGEMQRLIAQANARGQTGLAKHLQSELAWRKGELRGRAAPIDADPDDDAAPELAAPARAAARGGRARAWQLAAAAVGGAAVAGLAAWTITSAGLAPRSAAPPAAPPAALSAPRQAVPAPIPDANAEAAPAAPASGAEAPGPPAATLIPAPPATVAAAAPLPASHRSAACRARPTPGLRAVCASRSLSVQDQRMRRAYDRALAAGANRPALDRGQAQWRALHDRTSSPTRLAHLYRARIAALNAAAHRPGAHAATRHAPHRRWWRWW